jgi:hypothetical protein
VDAPNHTRRHPEVLVDVEDRKERIDEMIAPLVREIWLADIRTVMSCQETDRGVAWIEFAAVDDLARFLNVVAPYEEAADTVYDRVASHLCVPAPDGLWEYTPIPHDGGSGDRDPLEGDPVDFDFTAGAYLPQSDIPQVLTRLVAHNQTHTRQDRNESDVSAASGRRDAANRGSPAGSRAASF